MFRKIVYLPARILVMLAGIFCLVNIPILLLFNPTQNNIEVRVSLYIDHVMSSLGWFIHFNEYSSILNYFEGESMEKYVYTMTILCFSLLIVVLVGLLVSTAIMLLPLVFRKRLNSLIDFTTTAPDLLIIFLLQYIVIYLYKTFNVKLFQLYGGNYTEPYFMPIFISSFVPAIFVIQFLLKEFANEEQQDYVLLARAKGMPLSRIYVTHIIRNIIPLLLIHLRIIIWFLLSNIIVVEFLFNIHGFVEVLRSMYQRTTVAFALGFLLFAAPVIIANVIAKIVLLSKNRKGNNRL